MIDKLRVTRVEVFEFKFTTRDWGGDPKVPTGIYNPGTVREARSKGVRIHTDQGVSGTYIGGNDVEYAGIPRVHPQRHRQESSPARGHLLRRKTRSTAARPHGTRRRGLRAVGPRGQVLQRPCVRTIGRDPPAAARLRQHRTGRQPPGRAQFTGSLRRLRRAVLRIGLSSLQDPRLVGCANRKTYRSHSRRGQTHGRKDASHARSVLRHRKVRRRVEAGMGVR